MTGKRAIRVRRGGPCCRSSPSRRAGAWTAAYRSAIRVARWAISFRVERPGVAQRLDEALERLHATKLPEFTGRLVRRLRDLLCRGINREPVTIKNVEVAIIDKGWDSPGHTAAPEWHTGRGWRLVGSGPAGSQPPSSSPAPATRSWSTSGLTRPAG